MLRLRFLALMIGFLPPMQARAESCENNLTLHLEDYLAAPQSNSDRQARDTLYYILRGLVQWNKAPINSSQAEYWNIPCEALSDSMHGALLLAVDADGFANAALIRRLYDEKHLATAALRGHDDWIAPTVAEFARRTGFAGWDLHVVVNSAIKQKTRAIFRSPVGQSPAISVSQTHDTQTDDLSALVLETEIAIERRDNSGDWDFYSYNSDGVLSSYSTFPNGRMISPQICISCHYSAPKRTISRLLER